MNKPVTDIPIQMLDLCRWAANEGVLIEISRRSVQSDRALGALRPTAPGHLKGRGDFVDLRADRARR
jgi:hypothetical protein